jgi:hypothetical protein
MAPALLLGVLGVLIAAASPARAAIVIKQGAHRGTDTLVAALQQEAARGNAEARAVDLTGSFSTDLARVGRAAEGETTLFAIGPNATVLAGTVAEDVRGARIVALAVPNPEKLKTRATYISLYPQPDTVFQFLASRFRARRIGFLFSPAQNAALAATFGRAAGGRGAELVPIEARSAGELVRHLKDPLRTADVLVVPVDPLLFDRERLRIVLEETRAAGKPVIGFLPDLPQLGFTGALVLSEEAVAKLAWKAARDASEEAIGAVLEVKGPLLYHTADKPPAIVEDAAEKTSDAPKK